MTGAPVELDDRASDDLRWVVSVLWGGLEGVRVRLGDPRPGERVLADLVVVPDARRPRLLVPRDRRAARAAVGAGGSTRARSSRVGRAVARVALAGPASRLVFRDRLVVVADGEAPSTAGDLLAEALGVPVVLAVNVRPPSPSRKPVLQAMDREGRVRAYAKVAWHEASDANVRAEARFLRAVAGSGMALGAPVTIAEVDRDGHPMLITAPMPAGIRRLRAGDGPPGSAITRGIAELFGLADEPLAGGTVLRRLRERLVASEPPPGEDPGPDGELRGAVSAHLEALEGLRGIRLPVGAWHGDWSPWNLGLRGGRLWAWDWEYARTEVPLGLDLPHFGFQVAFVGERRSLGEALAEARRVAARPLRELGLEPDAIEALHAIHAAELSVRALGSSAARAAGGALPPRRFIADAVAVIRAETARIT